MIDKTAYLFMFKVNFVVKVFVKPVTCIQF